MKEKFPITVSKEEAREKKEKFILKMLGVSLLVLFITSFVAPALAFFMGYLFFFGIIALAFVVAYLSRDKKDKKDDDELDTPFTGLGLTLSLRGPHADEDD
ncbi:MAG: hypothetical protein RMI30_03960 [Thermodesulfovibrio sp.]|nr:hypothetical protein [Thermodesulfovibrio sp.]